MCGLVGALGKENVIPFLVDGLKQLEYRGYDSAGVAFLNDQSTVQVRRSIGKVRDLEAKLARDSAQSSLLGIGHTRWATHGEPEERNAHPHLSGGVAVVHNGIIENFEHLKKTLELQGYRFLSDTDTEVIAHLIDHHHAHGKSLFDAVQAAVLELSGSYAIAVMSSSDPETMVIARKDSPLVIGIGQGERYVASDAAALLSVTRDFVFLEDGDVAELSADDVHVVGPDGNTVIRPVRHLEISDSRVSKGLYRHYMLKEMHEQPHVLIDTLEGRYAGELLLEESLGFKARGLLKCIKAVHIAACGTSNHAGEVARYWIESLARIPCNVELASEFRYRTPVVPPDCLFVAISQSGETADTLAALRYAKQAGYLATLAICNVPESSLIRDADLSMLTRAGAEIGVASTKAFTTQLLSLLMLATLLARPQWPDREQERRIVRNMMSVGARVETTLLLEESIATIAAQIARRDHALFLGRGLMYPIAKEGALKLKEISYIHAEAYAAGELKHGPLALVDRDMPVIAVAPKNGWIEKLKSNLREVSARGGELYIFSDQGAGIEPVAPGAVIEMPAVDDFLSPITYAVALQLLAYHAALAKGTDVDKPRNLAKSVTVE